MKIPKILHPYLFAIFPVIGFYVHNVWLGLDLGPKTLVALCISIVFAFVLLIIANWIFDHNRKAALFVSILLVLFFSYGHFHDLLGEIIRDNIYFRPGMILLPMWALFLGLAFYFIRKQKKDLRNVTKVMNVMALTLIALPLLNYVSFKIKSYEASQYKHVYSSKMESEVLESQKNENYRDLYFIILDMYPSSTILAEFYDYDNSQFDEYLKQKGFYLFAESRSNYTRTPLSIAATLNMEYINHIAERYDSKEEFYLPIWRMFYDNKVSRILRAMGYKYVSVSFFRNKYADLTLGSMLGGEDYQMVFIQTTVLKPFADRIIREGRRKRTINEFKNLLKSTKIKRPKFVFGHVQCPHPPFVFGPNGEVVENTLLRSKDVWIDKWRVKKLFRDQVNYCNKRTRELVDTILANSEMAPIIVIQGDHGSFLTYDGKHMSGETVTDEQIRESFSILNALYLPGVESGELYEGMSSVNTFRLVFNAYFDTNYEILEDRNYFSTSDTPYKLTDVTGRGVVY